MKTTRFTRIGTSATCNMYVCAYKPRTRFICNVYVPQHRIVSFMNPTRTRQDSKSYLSGPQRIRTQHSNV